MLTTNLLNIALALVAASPLVSAGMFPKDSLVKMLDHKSFKQAMKINQTSLVAFVAPWCGHCQKMVPEYSKAALGLYPLLPLYAVNCHAEKNKKFCSQQGVTGFPTVKLFPRGNTLPPMVYDQERTASSFFYYATRRIPNHITKFYYHHEIPGWINGDKKASKYRILLLRKDKKEPLLWQTLANKYADTVLDFGSHRDKKGKSSVAMGLEAGGPKEPKVLVYPPGSDKPIRYTGLAKFDSLTKFFDSILDGTADLSVALEEAKAEEYTQDEAEAEIERKQEAQRIALLHGGFTDMIDFEKAMLAEGAADYHGTNGYGGMMGGIPEHMMKKPAAEASGVKMDSTKAPEATATVTSDATKAAVVPPAAGSGQCTEPSADGKDAGTCGSPDAAERPKDEL